MTIRSKYDGKCNRCGGRFSAGTLIDWSRGGRGASRSNVTLCVAETNSRTAQAAEAVGQVVAAPAARPVVSLASVAAFLMAARDRGLKFPKARFLAPGGGELRLYVAGPRAKVPGAVVVLVRNVWMGRVNPDGEVFGPLVDRPALVAALETIAADPAAAASAYGALIGRCSFCNLSLTDEGSVEVGYGPICAKKYGLPHSAKGTPKLSRPVPVPAQPFAGMAAL